VRTSALRRGATLRSWRACCSPWFSASGSRVHRTSGDLPDLRNGQAFIQDNLWSTETGGVRRVGRHQGHPWAGKRDLDAQEWEKVDLSRLAGNPMAAPTEDDTHNVYAIAVDALGHVYIAGNMHADRLRYVRTTGWRPLLLQRRQVAGPSSSVTYPQFVASRTVT
jgi:hypothetical protein